MEVTDFGLVAQRSLVQALGDCSLVLAPKEVSGSGLLWQRSLVSAWSCGGRYPGPAPVEVFGLYLVPTKVTVQACSLRSLSLVPVLGEVAAYSILNLKEASCGAISLLSCGNCDTSCFKI